MSINKTINTFILAVLSLACFNIQAKDLAFTIVPESDLPTKRFYASTVSVAYTVTNNADKEVNGNFVKYLPPNVTLTELDSEDNCATKDNPFFDLDKFASCTLNLVVSGNVNPNDPEPHHHLFVCRSDGYTCAGTNYPLNVNGYASIAVPGEYMNDTTFVQPLVAVSINSTQWSYAIDGMKNLPPDFTKTSVGAFLDTACTEQICAAVGFYCPTDNNNCPINGNYFPIVAASTDGDDANSWEYVIDSSTVPSNFSFGEKVTKVDCVNKLCAAVGQYFSKEDLYYPVIVMNTKGPYAWEYALDGTDTSPSPLPYSYTNFGILGGTACTDKICLAAGTYVATISNVEKDYPMLAINKDITKNIWGYAIDATANTLPSNYDNGGSFNSVDCSDEICIAGGLYNFPVTNLMLAVSTNDGANWNYAIDAVKGPELDDFLSGVFQSTSCSGDFCIAVGNYLSDEDYNQYPLIAYTTDAGSHWYYSVNSDINLPSDSLTWGTFLTSSCSGDTCMAGGSFCTGPDCYQEELTCVGDDCFPMLVVSTNGESWDYVVNDDSDTLPSDYISSGTFCGMNCFGNICVAGGQYTDQTINGAPVPMLLVSEEQGAENSWEYMIDGSPLSPNPLPKDFNMYGFFYNCANN